jgi:anti-anti-sigma regulatory factor
MLKITLQSEAGVLFFQLEGKLAGPWVKELERCWRSAADMQQSYPARVDLSAVTFIDGDGKALLGQMYKEGAELLRAIALSSS